MTVISGYAQMMASCDEAAQRERYVEHILRQFDIMSIPTLIVFKDGQPSKRLVGAKGKNQLLQELTEFL